MTEFIWQITAQNQTDPPAERDQAALSSVMDFKPTALRRVPVV